MQNNTFTKTNSQSTAVALEADEQATPPLKIGSAVEDWSNPALVGQYCCDDGKAYPGIISNIDESDVEVQCMLSVGENRFFWPDKRGDICWYPGAHS